MKLVFSIFPRTNERLEETQGVPGGAAGHDGPGDSAGPGDTVRRGIPGDSGDLADPRSADVRLPSPNPPESSHGYSAITEPPSPAVTCPLC